MALFDGHDVISRVGYQLSDGGAIQGFARMVIDGDVAVSKIYPDVPDLVSLAENFLQGPGTKITHHAVDFDSHGVLARQVVC